MAALTVSNFLGMLQADPYDGAAVQGLAEALSSGDPARIGDNPVRLLEMARVGHERRSELSAAAALIEVEALIVTDDPDFRAALYKELGRLRHEDLLDDEGAKEAYKKCLELRPGDYEVEEVIEQIDQAASNWRQIADRFIEEAQGASDATLKTSLLCRAASLVWQYKKKGKQKETDQLFQAAHAADPGNVRAARLYGITLRAREMWAELGTVLSTAASESRSRDEKINCWIEAARVYAKHAGDKDSAAICFQQVLDFAPVHEEALSFLVEYYTEREEWDHLVALYEDALRSRRKLESEHGILLQLGMVHWRIRNEPERAEPYFARLRKSEPAHPGMLAFYRELYANDAEGRLLGILADAQRVMTDPNEKLSVAIELANVAQASGHIERAIDAWKAVQRQRPDNPDANGALRVLYRRGEKWNALVEVLRAELDKLDKSKREERLDVLRELVPIYRDHLGLDAMVVSTYGQILELAPDDEEALAQLAVTYEQMGRWNDLIQVLTKQGEAEQDPEKKVATFMRVADLWISRFANYNQATRPLESVIEIDPKHRQALSQLKEIYGKKRAWKNLYEVLLREIELVDDGAERRARYVELAKLAGERLHQHADAIGLWKKVLELDPSNDEALESLEKLSEREKDWATLADVLERRAEGGAPQNRIKVLTKLGGVYGEQLAQPAKAASAWKRVLELEPKNSRALRTLRESFLAARDFEGLEGLYAEAQDWEGLVEVLGTAAERADDPKLKVDLSFRAAAIYTDRIGEPHRAFRNYERVLSIDPKNEAAARALLPIYERDEKWPRVATVLEILHDVAPESDEEQKLALAVRLRDLALEKLADTHGAFRWASRAYELAPADEAVQRGLERAAEASGSYEALAELYLARIAAAPAEEQLLLRRRVAAIAGERLGRRDESIAQLRQILEANPRDGEAIAVLDRLYRADERNEDLRGLYLHRLEHVEDDVERRELLIEVATLEEDTLKLLDEAAAHYRAALALDDTDVSVLEALDRLAVQGRRFDELATVLAQRVELANDDASKVQLLLRLGDVRMERLADVDGAIAAYGRVLEVDPGHGMAMQGLERIEADDPARAIEVGRMLEGAYERRGMYEKLAKVLEKRLAATTSESERRSLRLRLAELASSSLGDPAGAYASLEAAFLDTPDDAALWDRISGAAEAAGKQAELAVAFATAIEAGGLQPTDVAELARRVAELYDVALDRPADAEPFHRRVLAHDPLSDRAFVALKELYTNAERWDDLQALYRNRIAETVDADAKLELLLQVCFLFEELLDDPALAIRSYQEVLELAPDHPASHRALDRLYRRAERWRDLAALLTRELEDAEGQEVTDRSFDLALLYETKLEEPSVAVDYYEAVLAQSPTHLRAQEALERLITGPAVRQRIAAILEPIYESQGAWADLTRILEVELEAITDPASSVGTLMRMAGIYQENLHDPDKAFAAVARAAQADPADAAIREQLKQLATIRDAQGERAAVLEKAVEAAAGSTYLQSELLLELATLWYEEEQDFDKAEQVYGRLIATDPDNPDVVLPAARALERIHLERNDHAALAQDLRRQVKLGSDPAEKVSLLVRLADLLELTLEDVPGAIAAHTERLEIDPTDVSAMVALERLHERNQEWQKLIGVLQMRDGVTTDVDEQRALARRIGAIYETRLDDVENAIVAYNEVVSRFGSDIETLSALGRLYEAGEKWEDLSDVLEMMYEAEENPAHRAELRFRAAELMRTKTHSVERAIDYYNEVLLALPEHAGTIAALEEILTAPDGSARVAAARALVAYYRVAGKHGELLSALEVLSETDDPVEKLESLRQAAEVADVGLGDTAQAFALIGRAIHAGLGESDLGAMLGDFQRLAVASGKWREYVDLLVSIAPDVMDEDLQIEILMVVASVAESRLEDVDLARRYYGKVLEHRPDHRPALDALEHLHERGGDHAALLDIVRRKTEMTAVVSERVALLLRQADICDAHLGDVRSAIDALEQVLLEEERPEAFTKLEGLYARAERWHDLAELHHRELEKGVGAPVEVRHKLGRVLLERLSDPHGAIEQFRTVLAADNQHAATVSALEGLMADEEHRGVAAELLEPVFLARMDWPKVTAALEARLSAETDIEVRKELLRRVGQLHEDYLEDLEGALESYARLFREDPTDEGVWDTLTRLAKVLDKWGRLAEIYAGALAEIDVDEPATAKLAGITGRLYDQRLAAPEKAAAFYARALRFEPNDTATFELLEGAYRHTEQWPALLELYRERTDLAASDDERVSLLHRAAGIQESRLGAIPDAIDAYRQVLETRPDDAAAVDALDRLLAAAERHEELADHLRFRIDGATSSSERSELKYRLGTLLLEKLGDAHGAIDVFEEVVASEGAHGPTVAALEKLVLEPDHQARITQILGPLYRGADQWKKLVAVLEAEVRLATDPSDRARLLGEIAELHEQRGQSPALAFEAYTRAFAEEPHDERLRNELDRLAASLGVWDQHVAAYENALTKTDDPSVVSELLGVIARTHDERRGDPRAAIETYNRLVQHDPDDPSPLDSLEALHTMVGDWRGMVDVLARKVERSYEPEARAELLRRSGSVQEELLGDVEGAIEAYRRAAEEDQQDPIALEALDRLYLGQRAYGELADVLRRRVEVEEDSELKVEIGMRLAEVAEQRQNRFDDAIDALKGVLDVQPAHPEAMTSLARLYEQQSQWPELLDVLRAQADAATDDAARVTFLNRAGDVLSQKLDDVAEAVSVYQQALGLDGKHEPSIAALRRIARSDDHREEAIEILEPLLEAQARWDDLAEIRELKAEAATDPLEKRDHLRSLAKVHEVGRRDLTAAFDALRRALAEDPSDEDTVAEVERLAAELGQWSALADTLAARASSSLDPNVARSLYVRLAKVAEERLDDDIRAIEAYDRALEQVGDDDELLRAIDRLYTKGERWEDLGAVLVRRIDLTSDAEARAELQVRLGEIRRDFHRDRQGAFAAFQDVLESRPGDARALAALEAMTSDPDLAREVVDVLDRAYRDAGRSEKVAELYDVRIRIAESDGEKVQLLQELAALREGDLGDREKALEALRRAFELDPRDESILGELERLARAGGAFEGLRGLVESISGRSDLDRDLARDLNLRAAGWYRDELRDAAAAEARLRAAIGFDPEALEAHSALVDVLRAGERHEDLVAALRAFAEVDPDEIAKRERTREAAEIAEARLGRADVAAECYEAILRGDPSEPDALAELARLRAAEGRWPEVADLRARQIDVEMDVAKRLDLRRTLADLYAGPLGDPERATSAFVAILDEDPTNLAAIDSLEKLYEAAKRWDDLRDLLDRRLELAENDEQRIAARVRLARLSEQAFGRRAEAMDQLREILEIDRGNVEALDELERLLGLDEKWDDLVELLERRVDGAPDAETAVVFLDRLAALHRDRRNDAAKAIEVHDRILERAPGREESLRALVALHEAAGDFERVAAALERLLEVLSSAEAIETAHRLATLAEEKLGDAGRAESALRVALAVDPAHEPSRARIRAHLEKHGQHQALADLLAEEADETEDRAAKVAAYKRVAAIYVEKLSDPGTAATYLEKAVELTPEDRDALLPLCDLYIAAGRQQDAVPVLEKIIASFANKRSKELAGFHHRLGKALEGMGQSEKALEHYDEAFKIDLTNVAILRDLGKLTHATGDFNRAQKTFRALLLQKLNEQSGITKADVYFYLGDISAKQGDKPKAISMLERAVAEDKSHSPASSLLSQLKS